MSVQTLESRNKKYLVVKKASQRSGGKTKRRIVMLEKRFCLYQPQKEETGKSCLFGKFENKLQSVGHKALDIFPLISFLQLQPKSRSQICVLNFSFDFHALFILSLQ